MANDRDDEQRTDAGEPTNTSTTADTAQRVLSTAQSGVQTATSVLNTARTAAQNPGAAVQSGVQAVSGVISTATSAVRNSPAGQIAQQGMQAAMALAAAGQSVAEAVAQARSNAAASTGDTSSLAEARFAFNSTALPDAHWEVAEFTVREQLSQPYEATITLATRDHDVDAEAMLGHPATLTIERREQHHGSPRFVAGVVERFRAMPSRGEHRFVEVVIVPTFALQKYHRDSRVFQNQTSREIVATIFRETIGRRDAAFRDDCTRTPPTREYCVQYRQSNFDFVSYLLERDGIGYYFEHGDEGETLVLFDTNTSLTEMSRADGGPGIDLVSAHGGTSHDEAIHAFFESLSVVPGTVATNGYNFTQPERTILETTQSELRSKLSTEVYNGRPWLTLSEYTDRTYGRDDAATQGRNARERREAKAQRSYAQSDVIGMLPGRVFALRGHARATLDRPYFVVSAEHRGVAPEVALSGSDAHAADQRNRYENRLVVQPRSVPFRPSRTIKRRKISSMLTAVVVGPDGEMNNPYADAHGRVKIQFPWDRRGRRNENSSCFVRTMQLWAGANFGHQWVPRVGMEVVVQFLDGDPDHPVIVGALYNGINRPPFDPVEDPTRSGAKSHSVPHNDQGGHNELSFRDARGEEQIRMHAQKNWDTQVRNNRTTDVGHDESKHIGHDQRVTIDHDQSLRIEHDREKTVMGDESTLVHGTRIETVDINKFTTVHGQRVVRVDREEKREVGRGEAIGIGLGQSIVIGGGAPVPPTAAGFRKIEVMMGDELHVHGNKADKVERRWTMKALQKMVLEQPGTTITMERQHLEVNSNSHIKHTNPSGRMEMHAAGGIIEIEAGLLVRLKAGNNLLELSTEGCRIHANQIRLESDSGVLSLNAQGATLNGRALTLNSQGDIGVTGMLVRLNA